MALKNQKKNKRQVKALHNKPGNPFFINKLQKTANMIRKAQVRTQTPPFYLPDKND
jgi:hypothetical protein